MLGQWLAFSPLTWSWSFRNNKEEKLLVTGGGTDGL